MTLLYNEDTDHYFDEDMDTEFDHYYGTPPERVPEFVLGTKPMDVASDELVERLAVEMIEYIDENVPECSTEDHAFSEMLRADEESLLQDLIRMWIKRVVHTVHPDYDVKIPFREPFAEWLKEADETEG